MAAEKLLTEMACKAAKPQGQIYYLNDGAGLRLRIRPDGSKTWLYRFRLNGKENTTGLGSYPQVTLQIARTKAAKSREQVSTGTNPSIAKRVARASQAIKNECSFGLIARDWLEHHKAVWSTHHYERNNGLLSRYLLPDLGRLPIDSIEEAYLFGILKRVYDKGTKESARRALGVAKLVFSHARATHRGTINPARDMVDNPYFKKPPVRHFSALPQTEVGQLIKSLDLEGDSQILDPKTICALKLALYTGLRDNSIRAARWGEIDLQGATWAVPAERMKSRRLHIVPLPTQAVEALTKLHALTYKGGDSYVFPSGGKYGFMAENTLRLALHRLGFKVTAHGMRSLITDVLNENGFNSDAIERQLDHTDRDKVRRAYLRTDFMEERIRMMQWFANWCDEKAYGSKGGNVQPLRKAS